MRGRQLTSQIGQTPTVFVVAAATISLGFALWILLAGYGADNDTWLMLGTWDVLLDDRRYVPSRDPGYPLPEFVIGVASEVGGYVLSNLISILVGLGTLWMLHQLCRRRCRRRELSLLLTLVLAATPMYIIAAATSIDYVYGLFFFLAGWNILEGGNRPALAGLLLGLAAASRLTYAPLGAVVVLLGPGRLLPRRQRLTAAVALGAVAVVFYLPSALYHGDLGFLSTDRPTDQGVLGLAGRALFKSFDLLGLVGSVVAGAIIVAASRSRRPAGPDESRSLVVLLLVQLALWVWSPVEPSYLLPALAVVLIWLARADLADRLRTPLSVLIVCLLAHGALEIRVLEIDHLNRYGYDSCEPTDAEDARFEPDIRAGPLLAYPSISRELRACNERQRESQTLRS